MSGKYYAQVYQSGQVSNFNGPGLLPAGVIGCMGFIQNINLKTAQKFKIFEAGATGAIIMGMVPIITAASGITVVPEIKIYVADVNGNPVQTIIPGTPLDSVDTALDAFGMILGGGKTLYMTQGQTIWGEVTVGATGDSMMGQIDVLGYIPL